MPRSSCIEHPQRSAYITIWDHYLHMFDGSFPAAALLAALEFLCNGELDRLPDEQPGIIPWFVADLPSIIRTTLGMYSARTAQDALKRIEDAGLVAVDRRGLGKPNKYLFRYDRVQKAIRKRYIFDGNFAVEEWRIEDGQKTSLSTEEPTEELTAILPSVLPFIPILLNEDEYEDELLATPNSSTEPERTDLYEPPVGKEPVEKPETFVDNIYGEIDTIFINEGRPKPTRLMKTLRTILENRVDQIGKEKVVAEVYAYVEGGGRSLDSLIKSWKPRFNSRSVVTDAFSGSRSVPSRGADKSFDRKAALGSVQRERYSAEKPQPPEEAMRWNVAVPSRKWEMWGSVLDQALRDRLADGDFASRYDAMLAKCAAIALNDLPRTQYITFQWLLKDDNWMSLMNGACDWALEKKGRSKEVDTSMEGLIRPKKEKK